ncbi:uncharacterized protein BXZ73DRAFT_106003 [Epithele typhae]|uniref:uncharacterized protein n=1 Tax=Epithele typhae TaxID=378194 RepID=UPI00200726EA|nr:uncharacterized protein BXZ73DRAFT_106003 [Epithele typhae]KAH9915936.1 hypothetical protein BXZ73DRAFT_106003 [Epithele typhae]
MRAGRASLCKPAIAQPQHQSQKPAFLVPFEVFYDALTYARTLKGWPHEPPQKSAALTQAPQRQQEHVAAMVERWLGPSLPMIQIFCRSTPSVSHNHTLRVDIHGNDAHTGRRAGIGDVLPHPRANVLPFLPLLSDLAFTIGPKGCQFSASSPGRQHSVDIHYAIRFTTTRHAVCIEPEFQLRDLMDVSRDCHAATRLEISAEPLDLTTDFWPTLLGPFPLLTELCFEGHGSLASLWAALDPNLNDVFAGRTTVICPALRTIWLRDCSIIRSPWEAEEEVRRGRLLVAPQPRLDLSFDALKAMLCARAECGVHIVRFSYVAAPHMEELDEFQTVWRGEHATALAEHIADVSIKTMYKEVDGEDAKTSSWRGRSKRPYLRNAT